MVQALEGLEGVEMVEDDWDDRLETSTVFARGFSFPAGAFPFGKGVLVTESRADAESWVDYCLEGGFGDAGASVIIEEFLDGPEVSVFAVCTEQGAVALEPARDYKRLLEADEGPNTGGMGAYAPAPSVASCFRCPAFSLPASTASASSDEINSIDRMLSSLPGMGRSTWSGSPSVSIRK